LPVSGRKGNSFLPFLQITRRIFLVFFKTDAQLMQAQPQGFNLLGLVATGIKSLFKGGTSEKQKEKTKRMLDNY
jgi:hypothetical protein